jgi:hypothetical protein
MPAKKGRYLDIYDQQGDLIWRHTLSQNSTILVEEHDTKLKKNFRTEAMLEAIVPNLR